MSKGDRGFRSTIKGLQFCLRIWEDLSDVTTEIQRKERNKFNEGDGDGDSGRGIRIGKSHLWN